MNLGDTDTLSLLPALRYIPDPKSLDLVTYARVLYTSVKIIKSAQYTNIQPTSETASFPHVTDGRRWKAITILSCIHKNSKWA